MITAPSTARMIEVVRRELASNVAPAIQDEQVAVTLGMLDALLGVAAVRAEHECEWMRSEIDATVRAAEALDGVDGDAASAVGAALATLRAGRAETLLLSDLAREYSLAGDLLSYCIEATGAAAPFSSLLRTRLDREALIRGTTTTIGRH